MTILGDTLKQPGWLQVLVQGLILIITAVWVVSTVVTATAVLGVQINALTKVVDKLASMQARDHETIARNSQDIAVLQSWTITHACN